MLARDHIGYINLNFHIQNYLWSNFKLFLTKDQTWSVISKQQFIEVLVWVGVESNGWEIKATVQGPIFSLSWSTSLTVVYWENATSIFQKGQGQNHKFSKNKTSFRQSYS